MKKLTTILLTFAMALSLAACGSTTIVTVTPTPEAEPAESTPAASSGGDANTLVVYFSVMETDGVDTVGGASRVAVGDEPLGNLEYVAGLIAEETGGELFRIETVQEYPTTHQPLLEFAHNEAQENARPELASTLNNPGDYDVIFIGYPIWNADLPMPLYTFLESYDFGGATIVPFTVHGGSGLAGTPATIQQLQPDANVVTDALSISRNSVTGAPEAVSAWLGQLGL